MKETKRKLGKGLSTLLSDSRIREIDPARPIGGVGSPADVTSRLTSGATVSHIPVEKVLNNPHQPRQSWNEQKLMDLAESIKQNGLIQPILVRQMGDSYQLIAGERRLRATQIAGHTTIPSIIRHASEEQMIEWALVENIHRADLNPMERAKAYNHYIKAFELTQEDIAARLGEDRSTIANYLRLLDMTQEEQQLIANEELSFGHAKALLGIPDTKQRVEFAKVVALQKYSVRETERRIRDLKRSSIVRTKERKPHLFELEEEFTRVLGTKVTIKTYGPKGHRGKIIVDFYNLDDFGRIQEQLGIWKRD